jgi:hypothetical protein
MSNDHVKFCPSCVAPYPHDLGRFCVLCSALVPGLAVLFAIGYRANVLNQDLGPRLIYFLLECGYVALLVVYYRKRGPTFTIRGNSR